MAESIFIPETASRADIYEALLPQITSIIEHEPNRTANLANVAAVLKEAFGFFWVGFYLRDETDLVLGPFQGPLACTRIAFTKGVCGHAYSTQKSVLVPDVDQFPGHIACSSASKSEVVIPIFSTSGEIVGVLDVDSDRLDDFSEVDVVGLEKIMRVLSKVFN
ncbi:MAG: GAF domain-containing protein [Spirosomataceae bacterium]